jgi:hypothetical protein
MTLSLPSQLLLYLRQNGLSLTGTLVGIVLLVVFLLLPLLGLASRISRESSAFFDSYGQPSPSSIPRSDHFDLHMLMDGSVPSPRYKKCV